jgi:methionyl-tRNA synthetase
MENMITIDDFKKVEMKAGKVLSAEPVEGSEKLLKLSVDFGPAVAEGSGEAKEEKRDTRQVVSGIAKYIKPEDLVGTVCAFVTNLEPRDLMGLKSEAMIMALSTEDKFSLLKISNEIPLGSSIK